MIAKLIRQGILQNARFAAAVLVRGKKHGKKEDVYLLIRSDCLFPTLYQIRREGTIHDAGGLRHGSCGGTLRQVFPAGARGRVRARDAPAETRRAILAGIRNNSIRITHKTIVLKHHGEDDEEL